MFIGGTERAPRRAAPSPPTHPLLSPPPGAPPHTHSSGSTNSGAGVGHSHGTRKRTSTAMGSGGHAGAGAAGASAGGSSSGGKTSSGTKVKVKMKGLSGGSGSGGSGGGGGEPAVDEAAETALLLARNAGTDALGRTARDLVSLQQDAGLIGAPDSISYVIRCDALQALVISKKLLNL